MENYFLNPELTSHKQYEALRAYYVDKLSGKKAAEKYSPNAPRRVYQMKVRTIGERKPRARYPVFWAKAQHLRFISHKNDIVA